MLDVVAAVLDLEISLDHLAAFESLPGKDALSHSFCELFLSEVFLPLFDKHLWFLHTVKHFDHDFFSFNFRYTGETFIDSVLNCWEVKT